VLINGTITNYKLQGNIYSIESILKTGKFLSLQILWNIVILDLSFIIRVAFDRIFLKVIHFDGIIVVKQIETMRFNC